MGTTAEKLTYLNETKTQLKDMLNLGGASLTTEPFRQYVDTLKNRYLYFMNNGTQQVWDNWTKVNGTGTTLSLNNTENAPMSIVYKGNTSQTGTPTPDSPQPIHIVSGDNSINVVGVNIFDEVIENGYINYQTGQNVAGDNYRRSKNYIKVSPSQTYYLNMGEAPSGAWCGTIQYDKNKNFLEYKAWSKNTTQTMRNDTEYIRFYLNATSYDKICINVSNASINGTYYPYQSNSYDIDLGVENLLQFTPIINNANGITIIYDNDTLTINGTATSNVLPTFNTIVGNGQTHYLQTEIISGSTTSTTSYVQVYYPGQVVLSQKINENGIITGTLASGTYSTRLNIPNGAVFNNLKLRIHLQEGSTPKYISTTPIELCKIETYQDRIFKSTGKNLFDINAPYKDNYFIDATGHEQPSNLTTIYKASCKGDNSYSLSFFNNGGESATLRIHAYNNDTWLSQIDTVSTSGKNSYSKTFTTPSNANNIRVSYLKTMTELMLNEGSTPLPYEPYGTDWYVEKKIGKVVLNGSESWNYIAPTVSTDYSYFFTTSYDNILLPNVYIGLCDKFTNYGTYLAPSRQVSSECFSNGDSTVCLRFFVDKTRASNTTQWSTYLSNNNVVVYSPLKTPTYTKIEGTLKEQLESLKLSYENQTNISQTNNDLPFELDITALSKE